MTAGAMGVVRPIIVDGRVVGSYVRPVNPKTYDCGRYGCRQTDHCRRKGGRFVCKASQPQRPAVKPRKHPQKCCLW